MKPPLKPSLAPAGAPKPAAAQRPGFPVRLAPDAGTPSATKKVAGRAHPERATGVFDMKAPAKTVVSSGVGLDSRAVLPADMMIIGGVVFTVGVLVVRAWIMPALFTIVCALLCIPLPGLTELFYFVAMTALMASVGFGWERRPSGQSG